MASRDAPLGHLARRIQLESAGPYTLRSLIDKVPLSTEGEDTDVVITCVEFWEGNLYIGTSAGEILHFVSLPAEKPEESIVTFILASRLEPTPGTLRSSLPLPKGIQQIVLLPLVNKACVLSNNILTFYSLPELSPAFRNSKVSGCSWVGGTDLGVGGDEDTGYEVIMICIKEKIRLVRVGNQPNPRRIKDIEYPGCLASASRGRVACVADSRTYALLDIENQQKMPLFPISSTEEKATETTEVGLKEDVSSAEPRGLRSASAAHAAATYGGGSAIHSRNTSIGAFVGGLSRKQPASRSRSRDQPGVAILDREDDLRVSQQDASPVGSISNGRSPTRASETYQQSSGSNSKIVTSDATHEKKVSLHRLALLKPHISSLNPSEFLLMTGTSSVEPGVGIFVNSDGDVVRGTLEFSQYPGTVVTDGGNPSTITTSASTEDDSEGYVLATTKRFLEASAQHGLEIQRWDIDAGEAKAWLAIPDNLDSASVRESSFAAVAHTGLGKTLTAMEVSFPEVGERLCSKRFNVSVSTGSRGDSTTPTTQPAAQNNTVVDEWEVTRNWQEHEFAVRLGKKSSRVVTWSGSSIFWVVRNPLALRLDAIIEQALQASAEHRLDQAKLVMVLEGIRNQEARTETEFLSLGYIRQKISIILFADLAKYRLGVYQYVNEQIFVEAGLDPRIILYMVPLLREDITEGPKGIWIHAGLVKLMNRQLFASKLESMPDVLLSKSDEFDILGLVRRFLTIWRQRKGFGSIPDEVQVFSTVDAALLHVLLFQDQHSLIGSKGSSMTRAELYAVVDQGVDCFDRAVELLEEFHRLYVLSRLYQSRKMAAKVLATWARIINGEHDDGGELADGENEVRKYLVKIRDLSLVEEYGTWLARRNPALGVQVFTDDNSRTKLPPNQVVQLLRLHAPDAVKVYLEHLVFGKKNIRYANDLISYYLDNVLAVLKESSDARSILAQSHEAYRALRPPKPTYRQFLVDNAITAPWWHDRFRLLELLGGSHGAGFQYDVPKVLERIEPFEDALVPESIILDGRQGRHQQALRLLTHGLGDYHTAINYCLLGGSSIFHPMSDRVDLDVAPSREEQTSLFKSLLSEFLRIEDMSDRIERTSELLERFGRFFDVTYVLEHIPDSWSVELISAFLMSAFRQLVSDKSEAVVTKALSGAENLKLSAEFIVKCEKLGPHIDRIEKSIAS
ncbi:hypothetical protein MMC13_007796 [Lambiella insularis]|nr:hypothetical protein [Lambiella insularis]